MHKWKMLFDKMLLSIKEDSSPEEDTRDQEISAETLSQVFSQVELNGLVRDLDLPQNSVDMPLRITFHQSRHKDFFYLFHTKKQKQTEV